MFLFNHHNSTTEDKVNSNGADQQGHNHNRTLITEENCLILQNHTFLSVITDMTESMGESEAKVRPIHPVCYIYHNLQLTQDVNILVFSLPAEETLAQSYLLMAVASPKSRMKP